MAGFPDGGIEYIPDFTDKPDLTCIAVHGIKPVDVKFAPTFPLLY
ncbi:MAG: hypothetical protein O2852_03220 [Bacteroidetes bacterium]|nr:hypothetical protein [Bacteroidota bacterium]MDA0980350.1 hypothetical protein [Bacteroidota bacterium]